MKTSRMKTRRVELGMTQTELATAAKCSVASIARMEAGQTIPGSTLIASLAKALNVTSTNLRGYFTADQLDERQSRRDARMKAAPKAFKPKSAVCLSPAMVKAAGVKLGNVDATAGKLKPVFNK
jgi:transcriptional regulator with XRE-family HTH domain